MNYYVLDTNQEIALFDTVKKRLQTTLKFKPELSEAKIHQTTREIIELDGKFIFADEHSEEITEQEALEKAISEKEENALYVAELKDYMLTAIVLGDTEWLEELKAEYLSLIYGEEDE